MKKLITSTLNESMESELLSKLSKSIQGKEFMDFLRKGNLDIKKAKVIEIRPDNADYLGGYFVIFRKDSNKIIAAGRSYRSTRVRGGTALEWAFNETKIVTFAQLSSAVKKFDKATCYVIQGAPRSSDRISLDSNPTNINKSSVAEVGKILKVFGEKLQGSLDWTDGIRTLYDYCISRKSNMTQDTINSISVEASTILLGTTGNSRPSRIYLYREDLVNPGTVWFKIITGIVNMTWTEERYKIESLSEQEKKKAAGFLIPFVSEIPLHDSLSSNFSSVPDGEWYQSPQVDIRTKKSKIRDGYAVDNGKQVLIFVDKREVALWSGVNSPDREFIVRELGREGNGYYGKYVLDVSGFEVKNSRVFTFDRNSWRSIYKWESFVKISAERDSNFSIVGNKESSNVASAVDAFRKKLQSDVREFLLQIGTDPSKNRYGNQTEDTVNRFIDSIIS